MDNDGDGIWWATGAKNLKLTFSNNQWTVHFPGGMQRVFDADGRMVRHQDGWGKGWTFAYDAYGLLDTATHDNGFVVDFSHTGDHLTDITSQPKNLVVFKIDAFSNRMQYAFLC